MSPVNKKLRARQRKLKQGQIRLGEIEGWRDGDLVAVAPDGTVVPLCPEVLGCDWDTIRAKLADIDPATLPSLSDLRRDKRNDN